MDICMGVLQQVAVIPAGPWNCELSIHELRPDCSRRAHRMVVGDSPGNLRNFCHWASKPTGCPRNTGARI